MTNNEYTVLNCIYSNKAVLLSELAASFGDIPVPAVVDTLVSKQYITAAYNHVDGKLNIMNVDYIYRATAAGIVALNEYRDVESRNAQIARDSAEALRIAKIGNRIALASLVISSLISVAAVIISAFALLK